VRTQYGFKLKEYAPRLQAGIKKKYESMNNLVLGIGTLLHGQYLTAKKIIAKKKREFRVQNQNFEEMRPDTHLHAYVRKQRFFNKEMRECRFTRLQIHDMDLAFQKRYDLLDWQQGSGKTGVAYHYGKYQLSRGRVKNVIVTAPAIAIN
jgi:hypothetical protein